MKRKRQLGPNQLRSSKVVKIYSAFAAIYLNHFGVWHSLDCDKTKENEVVEDLEESSKVRTTQHPGKVGEDCSVEKAKVLFDSWVSGKCNGSLNIRCIRIKVMFHRHLRWRRGKSGIEL